MQEITKKLIEGKVAKVLNNRELVINRGSEDGVTLDMKFKVMDIDESIRDPETNEILGSINREKVRVKAVHVQPKFSIARTYETYLVGSALDILSAAFQLSCSRPERRVRTLQVSEEFPGQPIDEGESFVKIGDVIIQLEED